MLFFTGVRNACCFTRRFSLESYYLNSIFTSNVKTGGKEELLEKTMERWVRKEGRLVRPENKNEFRYDRNWNPHWLISIR